MTVDGLNVTFPGDARVVRDVSFVIGHGERVGLVGESGSGKSLTARAIMQLIPKPGQADGQVLFEGEQLGTGELRDPTQWRGDAIAMITQDPLSSLNPLMKISRQMTEMLRHHRKISRSAAKERAKELLAAVGIPDPERTLAYFPAVLSGGMRQRVALAIAISCDPRLLIADEPTTALDVTIQAQVLTLLERMATEKGSAVLLISHDLGVVAGFCERLLVMYAGRIVETGPTQQLISNPAHPYTRALLASVPPINGELPERLHSIPGSPPVGGAPKIGCAFAPRCPIARDICRSAALELEQLPEPGHLAACLANSDPDWRKQAAMTTSEAK